jgi:hypothetical protein
MSNLRPNWYNLNAGRGYPLDDKATGTADDGSRLLSDILVDCHLGYPNTAGRHAFVGALSVTDTLVTVVFLGSVTTHTARNLFTPLASVSLPKPVEPYVHYPVSAIYPGTGGFVVFGDTTESVALRFSTPQQSLLLPRCVYAYNPLPIPSLQKAFADTGLTGIVTITGEDDIEVVQEQRYVTDPGTSVSHLVDAIIVRLSTRPGNEAVLSRYIGPCGARPESRNCRQPGVEMINAAVPDCNGNIELAFDRITAGALELHPTYLDPEPRGTIFGTSFGLADVCGTAVVERFAGHDLCNPASSSSSSSSVSWPSPLQSAASESSIPVPVTRPCTPVWHFCVDFLSALQVDQQLWQPRLCQDVYDENFPVSDLVASDPYGLSTASCMSESSSIANPAVLCPGAAFVSFRTCEYISGWDLILDVDFRAPTSSTGSVIFGWRQLGSWNRQYYTYYSLHIDTVANTIGVYWYNGVDTVPIITQTLSTPLLPTSWYSLRVGIYQHETGPSTALVYARLKALTDPAFQPVVLSFGDNRFYVYGRIGVTGTFLIGELRLNND